MKVTVSKATRANQTINRFVMVVGLSSIVSNLALAEVDPVERSNAIDSSGQCVAADGDAVIAVAVDNIQEIEGNLRAQIYSSNPDDFLEKGKKLVRVDVPVVSTDTSLICVPLPKPGTYALVVMHDKNANGKADFFSEGFGFSNNPKLSFGPPDAEEVMITALPGVNKQSVTLNYIFGTDDENKDKRRRLRRR